jgi:uncharacterized protein YjiS (DUF1127 family)
MSFYRNTPMSDLVTARSALVPQTHDRSGWDQLVAAIALAWRTRATRRALPELSDHQLADIGLTRPAALAEAARLPWDTRPARRWRRTSGL